mmetsp:Transcript_32030/g.95689  ORF Transcript_32030/g.95689 Transcript_32030/m.95689 type:complete len:221 (+) Transcript_32030:152-814(+)|eukprot:365535-Chlamydomonas_euryale.AAC.35
MPSLTRLLQAPPLFNCNPKVQMCQAGATSSPVKKVSERLALLRARRLLPPFVRRSLCINLLGKLFCREGVCCGVEVGVCGLKVPLHREGARASQQQLGAIRVKIKRTRGICDRLDVVLLLEARQREVRQHVELERIGALHVHLSLIVARRIEHAQQALVRGTRVLVAARAIQLVRLGLELIRQLPPLLKAHVLPVRVAVKRDQGHLKQNGHRGVDAVGRV